MCFSLIHSKALCSVSVHFHVPWYWFILKSIPPSFLLLSPIIGFMTFQQTVEWANDLSEILDKSTIVSNETQEL